MKMSVISTGDRCCYFSCGLLPTFIVGGSAKLHLEVSENKGAFFPPSKIPDLRSRTSETLEILDLVLGMAQGLAASVISVQATGENVALLFPQAKLPEAAVSFYTLGRARRDIHSGFCPALTYEGRKVRTRGARL